MLTPALADRIRELTGQEPGVLSALDEEIVEHYLDLIEQLTELRQTAPVRALRDRYLGRVVSAVRRGAHPTQEP